MKHGVLIVLSLLMTHLSAGQTNPETSPLVASIAVGTLSVDKFRTTQLNYDDVLGSPYAEEEPMEGFLTVVNGDRTKLVPLQFDVYSGEFFYVDEAGKELVIDTKAVREINMSGKEEDYLFKRVIPSKANTFYDILYEDDDIVIYNEMEIILREGSDNGIVKTLPSFNPKDNIFHYTKGGESNRIKLKKKDVFKLFDADTQTMMQSYAKKHKLKLKSRKDYKQLFASLKL